MARALIQYRDYRFSATGRAWLGRKLAYEADAPASPARRALVTYSIQHEFLEHSFAENAARYTALKMALTETEGLLHVEDENGAVLVNAVVRIGEMDLPAQWSQNIATLTLTFTGYELTAVAGVDASYTPHGSMSAITLPQVTGAKESIKADRYSTRVANRRESMGAIALSGRIYATASASVADRRAQLQALAAQIRSIASSKDGELIFGAFDKVVRVGAVDADYKDGADCLDWSIMADYSEFPSGDYAEAEFTVTTKEDLEKSLIMTTVKGKVRADDEAGARTKAAAIKGAYVSGRLYRGGETDAQHLSGVDGEAFTELTFSYEFSAPSGSALSWKLTVSDKDDLKTGQIMTTYAGTVTGPDASSCLGKARDLGDAKYPIRLTANETTATYALADAPAFSEVSFSYEYLRKGARQYAEAQQSTDVATFGVDSTTVSGFAVAVTNAAALTLARTFMGGGQLLSKKEQAETVTATNATSIGTTTGREVKVTFQYNYFTAKAANSTSIQYVRETSTNRTTMESMVSYSGTCWADTEEHANTAITALCGLTGSDTAQQDRRSASYDADVFKFMTFQVQLVADAVAGAYGTDGILEAEYSLETVYSVNQAILTPIPYGTPYLQADTGMMPGSVTASGQVTALTEGQARTWARSKVPTGGSWDPPRETVGFVYRTGGGTTVRCVRMSFTYPKKFASVTY